MADVRWKVTYKGETFEFDAYQDLTVSNLRQMKRRLGAQYGQFVQVLALLSQGDADAWTAAIWICLKKAGKRVPDDWEMIDFPVGELMEGLTPLDGDEDEAADAEGNPTEDSAEIPA